MLLNRVVSKAVLGDLEWKIFAAAQPQCPKFTITLDFIFVRKTDESFL